VVGEDLLPVENKMFTLLGVAGQRGAGHGQFQTKVDLDGGIDHGIEPENFLLSVGVLRVTSDADSSIHVRGELRAAKEEGVILDTVIQSDLCDETSFDDKIEIGFSECILKVEDLVEDAGVFRVGLLKAKCQDLHLRSGDIWGESMGRAFCTDADFFAQYDLMRISETVKNASSHVIDDTSELDVVAVLAEIGTAFVPGIGWEKGAVGGENFKGDKA